MGLYKVRLYNLATMDKDMNLYEAYRVGFIIVSNGIFNCEEVFDKGKIPIVDKRKDYAIEDGEHIDSFHIHLNSRIKDKLLNSLKSFIQEHNEEKNLIFL